MSLEFPTADSTQPNGGLSHTGTPKPAGKELRPADPLPLALGTSHWHFSRNSRSNPIWLHQKYTVIYFLQVLSGRNSFKRLFLLFSLIISFPLFLFSLLYKTCPLSPFLSLSIINTLFNLLAYIFDFDPPLWSLNHLNLSAWCWSGIFLFFPFHGSECPRQCMPAYLHGTHRQQLQEWVELDLLSHKSIWVNIFADEYILNLNIC